MTLRLAARIVATSISVATAIGCDAGTVPLPAPREPLGARDGEVAGVERIAAAWGEPAAPASAGDALAAEFARRADASCFADALRSDDPAVVASAAWSLARIGGEPALERMIGLLDGDRATGTLGAYALLEAPRDVDGDPLPVTGRWRELEDALWTRYAMTDDDSHADALLLSLARVGGAASVRRLATDLAHLPAARDASALRRYVTGLDAMAILCARGLPLELRARDAVAQGLDHGEARIREASAHALARCVTSSAELIALTEERAVLLDRLERQLGSSGDQRLAWKAFATIGETPRVIPPGILGSDPPAWIAEVEAVRALATTPEGRAALLARLPTLELESIVEGPRLHVVLEALRSLRGSAADDPRVTVMVDALLGQLAVADRVAGSPRRESASVHLHLELETLAAIAGGRVDRLPDCREDDRTTYLPPGYCANAWVEGIMHMTRPAASRMEAASNLPLDTDAEVDDAARRGRLDRLLHLARDGDAATATPALAALAEVADPRAKEVLRSALTRDDAGVRAAAATAIATRSLDAEKRDLDAVPALTEIVLGSTEAEDVEARIAAVAALGGLARAAHAAVVEGGGPAATPTDGPWLLEVIVPLAHDPHVAIREQARRALLDRPELLASFDAQLPGSAGASPFAAKVGASDLLNRKPGPGLRIHTRDGEIDIAFAGAPAPINQANLQRLAEAGFFDGLRFHRVVPGFVVQGGDPRGDGYGGPGYLLPCEWSNLRYERGTVGIALAGKDTGGSQIFITQSTQPHLDARYTIVGHVVRGMDVVDRLLPGDVITSVTLLEHADASPQP